MKRTFKITALALILAASGVHAQIVMSSGVAIIPSSRSPSYSACLVKLETFLETGVMFSGNSTNDPTVPLFPDRILPEYLMESSAVMPLWFGNTNTALINERGNIPVFWLVTQNPQGLRLANQQCTIASSDTYNGQPQNSLGAVQRMDGINYSPRAVGTNDSGRVTSGSPTQVVKRLYYTGFGKNYTCGSQADINNIRAYILQQLSPFTITGRWDSLNDNGSSAANVVVNWSVVPNPALSRLTIRNLNQEMVQVSVAGNTSGPYVSVSSSPTASGVYTNYATVLGGSSTLTLTSTNPMQFFR